jgi:hypothetical protein
VGEDIDTASNMAMGGVRYGPSNNTLFGCTGVHTYTTRVYLGSTCRARGTVGQSA